MRFTEHVAQFKVFKKYFKIVNAEVCYLGFPTSNFKILLEKNGITKFAETEKFFIVHNTPLLKLIVDLKRISQAYFVAINRKLEHLYLSLT